jgi:putative membrane protein
VSGFSFLFSFAEHVFTSIVLGPLAIAVMVLSWRFYAKYVKSARVLATELKDLAATTAIVEKTPAEIKGSLAQLFEGRATGSQWREFSETLHEEYEWIGGERTIAGVRATVPSQVFFSSEAVIEPRIDSEFFKHLPGILTGIGIIGTFFGLVTGVAKFDPSKMDPLQMSMGLKALFTSVEYAFCFSGICIALAILITFIEKRLFAACLENLGKLNESLDGLFRTGVGEEYLSRLVDAAQESASQTKQLKESLVADLKGVLTELTERQIAATNGLSTSIGEQISKSLEGPLNEIAQTVRIASGEQNDRASAVLENLMTAFMEQMRQSMGNQISGLTTLLQGTADTLAKVELSMRGLVSDLRNAGGEQAQNLTEIAQRLLADVAAQQARSAQTMDESLSAVLSKLEDAIRRFVEVQEEAQSRAQNALEQNGNAMHANASLVSQAVSDALAQFAAVAERMAAASANAATEVQKTSAQHSDEIAKKIAELLSIVAQHREASDKATQEASARVMRELEQAIQRLVAAQEAAQKHAAQSIAEGTDHAARNAAQISEVTQKAIAQMAELTEKVSATSIDAVTRLNSSAEALRRAVDGLSGATSQLGSLVQQITSLQSATIDSTQESKAAALALATAGQYVASSVSQLDVISEKLKSVANSVTTEAQVRASTLAQIEVATRSAQEAALKFANLTEEVKRSLAGNMDAFGAGVTKTLQTNLAAYEKELGGAVNILSAVLSELAEFTDGRVPR